MPDAKSKIFLTLDTDWCPPEILHVALDLFTKHSRQCTVFTTGRYAALDQTDSSRLEIGLHPNFNDTMPQYYETRLKELQVLYPKALGVSSHAMLSSTPLLELFKGCGLKYDRNLLVYKQAHAAPFYHYNGLLRIPIFWEDDIWFATEPGLRFSPDMLPARSTPCLFNFHPIHLYMNTASSQHYASFKPHYHEFEKLGALRHQGYGVLSFFVDLMHCLQERDIATGLLKELIAI